MQLVQLLRSMQDADLSPFTERLPNTERKQLEDLLQKI